MTWSVRDRSTFDALRRSPHRVRHGAVTVTWCPGDPGQPPRVAYAIGRKTGGAVVRNRLRRRLREVVREVRPLLGTGAYLVGAGAAAASMSFGELKATVSEALRELPESARASHGVHAE